MGEHLRFLRTFLQYPVLTGAVAPSSSRLARRMVEGMGIEEADTVVELGPGTGSFTRAILDRTGPRTLILALEVNPGFAAGLERSFDGVKIVNDSAESLERHLAANGRASADCIVSGLPWAGFSRDHQERLMRAVVAALRPGGRFATFAYVHACWLPPGRRLSRMLRAHFAEVEASPVVWLNLPPAFVFRCRKEPPAASLRVYNQSMSRILKLDPLAASEERELDFELDFQRSLTTAERFQMMFQKSREMAEELLRRGHRRPVEVIKRP